MNATKTDLSTIIVKILFFALVATFLLFTTYGILLLILPFGISLVLAFALSPMINFLERLRLPRTAAVLIIIPSIILVGVGLVFLAMQPITNEINELESEMEVYQARILRVFGDMLFTINDIFSGFFKLTKSDLPAMLREVVEPLKKSLKDTVTVIPTILTYALITPIITLIFLLQGHEIYRNMMAMVPNRYFEMTLLLVQKIKQQIASYLKGLMIQWTILTLIMGSGFYFIGLPYGPLIGILAASVNIVPYLGPIIGLVPALILAMISPEPGMVSLTLIIVGIAQLVDNMFTQPVVLAKSVQIHPLISILAVITAISLNSLLLLLVAIPLAGILIVSIEVMYRSLKAFRVI